MGMVKKNDGRYLPYKTSYPIYVEPEIDVNDLKTQPDHQKE